MSTIKKPSITLMILLLFSVQACTDIFLSGLPLMAKEFHSTIATTNLTISSYNYSQAFFFLFMGGISDLFGRRSSLIIFLIIHIFASICIAFSSLISFVIILRTIQALGSAAITIALRLIIKETLDKKAQIHAAGLLSVGLVLSPIIAPVLGAWLIHYFNWRACFWAIAILEAILLIWVFLVVQETNPNYREIRASFNLKNHFTTYYSIVRDNYFLSLALIVGAAFASFYSFISISSYIYISQYNVKYTDYSYVFIVIALAYLLANRVMSKLNAKGVTTQKIIKRGIVLSFLGIVLISSELVFHDRLVILSLITIGICLLRASTALINPPIQVLVPNYFQPNGGYALGVLTCIQYIFAAVGTSFVSGLPFIPSHNFIISTLLFTTLSFAGYVFYARNNVARK